MNAAQRELALFVIRHPAPRMTTAQMLAASERAVRWAKANPPERVG